MGSYKNGLKYGQWEIKYRECNNEEFIKMYISFLLLVARDHIMKKAWKMGCGLILMMNSISIIRLKSSFNKKMNIGLYISGERSG